MKNPKLDGKDELISLNAVKNIVDNLIPLGREELEKKKKEADKERKRLRSEYREKYPPEE